MLNHPVDASRDRPVKPALSKNINPIPFTLYAFASRPAFLRALRLVLSLSLVAFHVSLPCTRALTSFAELESFLSTRANVAASSAPLAVLPPRRARRFPSSITRSPAPTTLRVPA